MKETRIGVEPVYKTGAPSGRQPDFPDPPAKTAILLRKEFPRKFPRSKELFGNWKKA
jgi:hypothetical protein